MKNLIKVYGRVKMLGYTGLDNAGSSTSPNLTGFHGLLYSTLFCTSAYVAWATESTATQAEWTVTSLYRVDITSLGVEWERVHSVRRPLFGLSYEPRMMDDLCGAIGGMRIGKGNRSTRRKPAPSATSSTINPTWLVLRSKPGRLGGKHATTRLSYGTD
jgi:hypothetical protein